ncbi:MAG: fused response regulator/phosphatase [Alteromonadales bacterium]|nr:fused response regulator/phosphatase [Alteromonadales bacterium]
MSSILLVDDNKTGLVYMSTLLKKRGFNVVTALSGKEALEILMARDGIQFVLSDWVMPEMDGVMLCQTLKSLNYNRYIFFVLLSAKNDQASIIEGINAGADDFVDKQTSIDELEARIRAGFRNLRLHNELVSKNTELDKAYETIKRDLDSASDLIRHLLPKNTSFSCVELSYISIPSAQIGGDMLGYMQLDPDHIGFYLFDVAGHGVSSALMSFSIQQSLSVISGNSVVTKETPEGIEVLSPPDVIARLNEMYMSGDSTMMYFTMIYAVLNTETGQLSYCCAGHPPLVWSHASKGSVELIGHENFVVGAFESVEYESSVVQLEAGDKIWFYSDGLTEAEQDHKQFSEQGLRETIELISPHPTHKQPEMLVNRVRDWQKSEFFDDDISVLVAEWKGPTGGDSKCNIRLVNKATAQFFK